jgi:cell division protein ZapA
MSQVKHLDITIMGRELRVACPEAEQAALTEAVAFLDTKMHEIRDAGAAMSIDKIAILAALNITHEYLATRLGGGVEVGEFKRQVSRMHETLDNALTQQNSLF